MLYLKNEDSVDSLNNNISTIMKRRVCETDNVVLNPYSSSNVPVTVPIITGYNRTLYTIEIHNASSSGVHVSNCWVTGATLENSNPTLSVYVSNGGDVKAKILVQVFMLYVRSDIKLAS